MSKIKFLNVNKFFSKNIKVIDDLTLEMEAGKFIVLVGSSGCGKTTILRLIAGLETVSTGKIFFDEQDVTDLEGKKRGVAMVFQNYVLYPHLTVYKNIEYPLNILKVPHKQKQEKIMETLQLLGIEQLKDRKPAELSGGQKQRVAIGRAVVRDPNIFLFDEPLSNLDIRLREDMRLMIYELHKKLKKTTIFVTHDQHEAMSLADKIFVINAGKTEQSGTPEEVYANPKTLFTAKFIGSPQINIFRGEYKEKKFICDAGSFFLPALIDIPLNGNEIFLCIRAEHIQLEELPNDTPHLKAYISRVEYLGNCFYYHLKSNSQNIIVNSKFSHYKKGVEYTMIFPKEYLFFFNTDKKRIL